MCLHGRPRVEWTGGWLQGTVASSLWPVGCGWRESVEPREEVTEQGGPRGGKRNTLAPCQRHPRPRATAGPRPLWDTGRATDPMTAGVGSLPHPILRTGPPVSTPIFPSKLKSWRQLIRTNMPFPELGAKVPSLFRGWKKGKHKTGKEGQ